jgi:hypothetical protein
MRRQQPWLFFVLAAGVLLLAVGVFWWGYANWLRPLLRGIQDLGGAEGP